MHTLRDTHHTQTVTTHKRKDMLLKRTTIFIATFIAIINTCFSQTFIDQIKVGDVMPKDINKGGYSEKENAVADAMKTSTGPDRLSAEENLDLKNAIEKLPSKHKPVFKLLYIGLNEREIAEELSLKKGTVKSRISRGKKMLQTYLESFGA